MIKTVPAAIAALLLGSSLALAQTSPAGSPADPNSAQNRQPGPSATQPSDPAAGENPNARIPTAQPDGSANGASTGEGGTSLPGDTSPVQAQPTNPVTGSGTTRTKPTAPPKGFQQ